MTNYKTLLFSSLMPEDMTKLTEEKDGIKNTGIFFESRYKDLIRVKAHLTLPAIQEVKKILIENYGEKNAHKYIKEFFEILLKLNKNNTALLSVYIPESVFSRQIREKIKTK